MQSQNVSGKGDHKIKQASFVRRWGTSFLDGAGDGGFATFESTLVTDPTNKLAIAFHLRLAFVEFHLMFVGLNTHARVCTRVHTHLTQGHHLKRHACSKIAYY